MFRRKFIAGVSSLIGMTLITEQASADARTMIFDTTNNPFASSHSQLAQYARVGPGGVDDNPTRIWLNHNGRKIPVFIYMPSDKKMKMTPMVFSHQELDAPQSYDNFLKHISSHGFFIMVPVHQDSSLYPNDTINDLNDLKVLKNLSAADLIISAKALDARLDDVKACINSLPSIADRTGILFNESRVFSGHGIGADVMSIVGGANSPLGMAITPKGFAGSLLIKPHGNAFNMTEKSYANLSPATMTVVGDKSPTEASMSYQNSNPGNRIHVTLGNDSDPFIMGNTDDFKNEFLWLSLATAFLSTYANQLQSGIELLSSGNYQNESNGFFQIEMR